MKSLSPLVFSAACLSFSFLNAAPPAAPTALQVSPLGRTSHVMRWNGSIDVTSYTVEGWNGSAWAFVATVGSDVTSYTDTTQSDGALPKYRVFALNADGSSAPSAEVTSVRMNVLFFYADDMGFKDVVANRNPTTDGPTIFETPNLDTLVAQGVNFTQAYSSGPKCVVARRAMQTGMYDFRPAAVAKNGGIGNEMITIGEAMKAGGYRTCFIGKWHLGGVLDGSTPGGDEDFSSGGLTPHVPPVYKNWSLLDPADPKYIPSTDPNYFEGNKAPSAQGYDVAIAAGEWGAPPISYFANAPTGVAGETWYGLPDLYTTNPNEYLTDRLTTEATGFMANHLATLPSQPFFLMLAHYAVHTPLEAKPADIAYFEAKKTAMAAAFASHPAGSQQIITEYTSKVRVFQDQTTYAAMVKTFDESLASLRSYLAATDDPRNPGKKLSETTIIVYSSDHGGKSTHWINSADSTDIPTSNYPLRQGKTWCYEGGLRTPLVVYWPGINAPGATSSAFVNGADFYTTFLDMTGTSRQPTQHLDSISFAKAAISPTEKARVENIHWFTNADDGTGNPALGVFRFGNYKLVYHMIRRIPELYNLAEDIGETKDISVQRPDLTSEYLNKLISLRDTIGGKQPIPTSNSWTTELKVIAPVVSVPSAVPNAIPSGLAGTAVSDTAIDLTWTDASSDEERFNIQRKLAGSGAFLEITTVPANVTRFRDTGLTPGTSYQYRIQAENLKGWAGPSNSITVATPASSSALPVIARGDYITALKNEIRVFQPLANDQGKNLTITSITQGTKGVATLSGASTTITYVPTFNATGEDLLTYTASDGGSNSIGYIRLEILAAHAAPIPPLVYSTAPSKTLVDAWEFNDANGTRLDVAAKAAGSSAFTTAATPTVQSGSLRFAQGTATASIFRNATIASGALPLGNPNSGSYEISFKISGANLAGGTSNATYIGIGTRGKDVSNANSDPLQIRLQESGTNLELQARGASVSVCRTFTGLTLSQPLEVRVVMDLANKTGTVYSKLGTEAEVNHGAYSFTATAVLWDTYRLASLNNTTDWGASDFVDVDYLRINSLTYPAPPTAYQMWIDALQGSVTPSASKLPLADPDGDGVANLLEYAYGGDPYDGAYGVQQFTQYIDTAADVDTTPELIVTMPVRREAMFPTSPAAPLSATANGVNYTISGSLDLQTFTSPVQELYPSLEGGLPPVMPGFEYRTFRIPASNGAPRAFLKSGVTIP